jgi:type I restriction enzyme S subunit
LRAKNAIVCDEDDVLMLMDGARSGVVFRGISGIVSSTFALVRTEAHLKHVVYEYLRAGKEAIISNNTGSAIPHANKEFINRMTMFLPVDGALLDGFNKQYETMFRQRQNLARKNASLIASRDALLPRLISGKLSVDALDIRFPPGMVEADA